MCLYIHNHTTESIGYTTLGYLELKLRTAQQWLFSSPLWLRNKAQLPGLVISPSSQHGTHGGGQRKCPHSDLKFCTSPSTPYVTIICLTPFFHFQLFNFEKYSDNFVFLKHKPTGRKKLKMSWAKIAECSMMRGLLSKILNMSSYNPRMASLLYTWSIPSCTSCTPAHLSC